MKKILLSLILFSSLTTNVHAECWCDSSAFLTWSTVEWPRFTAFTMAHYGLVNESLKAINSSLGYSSFANIETAHHNAADKAAAEVKSKYEADNVDRIAKLEMKLNAKTIRQDSPMTIMNLQDPNNPCAHKDGSSVDGENAILGINAKRELKDLIRSHGKLDGRPERGGGGINETRALRRNLAKAFSKESKSQAAKQAMAKEKLSKGVTLEDYMNSKDEYGVVQILPKNGLTYSIPGQAKALGEVLAMAMNPDPWPAPEYLKFDDPNKADEYKAMLMMQDVLKDPELDAIGDYIAMHTGVVAAEPVWNLIKLSGGANSSNPEKAYPADQNKKLSMADLYRAWGEHYLSPAMANGINSDNASSVIQQCLARTYLIMLDGNKALQNVVAITALKQSGAKQQIDKMRTAFMNASTGSGSK